MLLSYLLFLAPAFAADLNFPPLTGRVVDQANILSPGARDKITGWLAAFEQESGGRQVVVATVKSLEGVPIEDYGYRLGRAWGIGQKDKNTGAILLVAPNERNVRIEVGYGLEGELTDALSKAIIEQDILPAFRNGNYEQGITAGTVAILRALGWKGGDASAYAPPLQRESKPFPIISALFIFIMFAFFVARLFRAANRYHGGGIGMMALGYGLGALGGGGFSSGGGFSGGGGSFGGGGASGSW